MKKIILISVILATLLSKVNIAFSSKKLSEEDIEKICLMFKSESENDKPYKKAPKILKNLWRADKFMDQKLFAKLGFDELAHFLEGESNNEEINISVFVSPRGLFVYIYSFQDMKDKNGNFRGRAFCEDTLLINMKISCDPDSGKSPFDLEKKYSFQNDWLSPKIHYPHFLINEIAVRVKLLEENKKEKPQEYSIDWGVDEIIFKAADLHGMPNGLTTPYEFLKLYEEFNIAWDKPEIREILKECATMVDFSIE